MAIDSVELKFDDEPPNEEGWYPVIQTWFPDEEASPEASYWNGKIWSDDGQPFTTYYDKRFDQYEEAYKWAVDNKVGWIIS